MKIEDIQKNRAKKMRSKHYYLSHEGATARRLLGRLYRRTQKQKCKQDGEDNLTPIGKDYKTRGWVSR